MRTLIDAAGQWTPSTLRGGSEECICGLSAALALRGHEVAVCNGCGRAAGNYNGVEYIDGEPAENDDPALVIVWRDWAKVPVNRQRFPAATIVLWCHDIPVPPHWPDSPEMRAVLLRDVDRVVLLNAHHRGRYEATGLALAKAAIIRIGIDQAPFEAARRQRIVRDPHRCLFVSHPHRGLDALRAAWPFVRDRVPDATLAAFWWESALHRDYPPVPELGILPLRALEPGAVAAEILASGVLGYPCRFDPEISPASVIGAQIGGAVPVVIPKGGMGDVLHFGHATDEGMFPAALARALTDVNWQERVRADMMPTVSEIYRWERAAAEFEELVH